MKKFLLLIVLFFVATANAQEYKFNIFLQEQGLPQPYVYDIVQDKRGFLYIATGDGLASYAGKKMARYSKKDSLSENYCSALFLDSKQNLWVGHFEGHVTKGTNNKFKKIHTNEEALARVNAFAEDSRGYIYFSNAAGGLYVIKEDGKPVLYTEEELPPINEIKIKDDRLYVATQEGVLVFELGKSSRSSKTIEGTKDKNITCLEISPKGELWLGEDGIGVELFLKSNNEYRSLLTFSVELKSQKNNIKDICLRGDNEMWVSLTGEGLCMLRYTSNYRLEKQTTINTKNGLQSLFINRIFIDKEANLWFGSTGNGLFQFLSSRFERFNKTNFLPFDDVRTVAVDDSLNVYVSDEKKVFAFNANEKLSILHELIPKGVEEEIRTSFINKQTNELWIGTSQNLHVYTVANGQLKYKNAVPIFKGKGVNYVTKDQTGQYLICTTEGLFYTNEKFEVKKEFNTNTGAPHNNFISVFVDRSDVLWAFSPETPLYSVVDNTADLEKTIISQRGKGSDTLSPFKFNSATQDRDDNIWFATEGDGVYCYRKNRKPNFAHYTTEEGLGSDFCYGIAVTEKGDVITIHKSGISIKYQNVTSFRAVNKSSGLPANTLNTNAIFKGKKGNIWMGSTEGLIRYIPSEDNKNVNTPILSFLSITTNSLARSSVTDSLYKLDYNKYELVIEFIGVSLTNPDGVTYKYKLEGFEDNFRTTNEEVVTYPNLADGEYQFIIYAKNSDGFETGSPATFKISIGKPFWKKLWFIASASAFVILVFFLIFRWRTKKLQRDKEILEGLVQEKTAELVLEKEKIEQANEQLNEKNQDITASIAYAKRIQTAVLPDPEYIGHRLNLFVLYKPRDIVSGDFYWYTETEHYTYVAVVDCTGHGVPGAFMSLLGSTFLDQVLIENKEATPALILNELDKKLHKAFKRKDGEENRIGDGMDAIVMRVEKANGDLLFSGANRPLYFYSKEGPQDFKAPIYSIGGTFPNEVKGFTDTLLKPQAGDCAYMFSDGFGDQFGGEKNKRYSTKRMKAYLGEIYTQAIPAQYEAIDKEFEDWKGDYEQMDDICVIGIKF
jgi:ligand-binding sensor domain-containing protein/serine phosphatase RsbU (regulator of sigma subunit)